MNPEMFGASKLCPLTGFLRHKSGQVEDPQIWRLRLRAISQAEILQLAENTMEQALGYLRANHLAARTIPRCFQAFLD